MWPSQQPAGGQGGGLFTPVATVGPSTSAGPAPMEPVATTSTIPDEYTLDESVFKTIWRDVVTIAKNVRSVLIPINWKFNTGSQTTAMRNWDLWGPLVFMLTLAITLSWGEKNASAVFAMVFAEVALGSMLLTINVILLGGEIVFFQSLCLFGYCLCPLCVAAIICANTSIKVVRILVIAGCLVWSMFATLPFIGGAAPPRRKGLAVYPVCLMYISIAWLALVKS